MNRFSLLRFALAFTLIALASGCKSSKATDVNETTAAPINVSHQAQPGSSASPGHAHSGSDNKAQPFPPTPTPTPGPADAELNYRTHKVTKGDTFYGIAKQYGVNAKDVINANPGVEPTLIRIGQEIIVPIAKK